ncbi:hypothetical protein PS2_001326 [Malus domestica]
MFKFFLGGGGNQEKTDDVNGGGGDPLDLQALPEGCTTTLVSLTTPRDAGMMSSISRSFRDKGYTVDFLSISLHAMSRDSEAYTSPCIYT